MSLLQVSRIVDGNGVDNLIDMILIALMHHGGLYIDQVGQKLTCFNANGASIF
jgi:hypothetical protein